MKPQSTAEARGRTERSRVLAATGWLAAYDRSKLRGDLTAGATLAAFLVPAGIGDASLAGLPPEMGLYACLFAGSVFWLFCSSNQTAVTVTSAISLLMGTTLGGMAAGDAERFATLATATALLVAAIGIIAWAVRAGAIVRFISEGGMVGFKCGVALVLASTQLPKIFGIHGAHGSFWENANNLLTNLNRMHSTSFVVGATALTIVLLGKVLLKHKPVALFVVIGGILASNLLDLQSHGVALLGQVPQGLPTPGLPGIRWSDVNDLLPLALACF
ncbi:MAG TPA: SulP family inorganic anion transporter, partial [Lacipirellulaceae bacterium]|nr:SulP family inorganic anion transporter [Lacipirellulaceae bacterium]